MASHFALQTSNFRRAFTLIEVMVVVVIIGVLSAAVLPSLGGPLARRKLSVAAADLQLAMRHVREVAVVNRRVCRLVLQPGQLDEPGRYAAEYQSVDLDAEGPYTALLDTALPATELPKGVRFGDLQLGPEASEAPGLPAGGAAVVFYPDGSADAAVVTLTDGQRVWSVVVQPNTGRARRVDGPVDGPPQGREDLDA